MIELHITDFDVDIERQARPKGRRPVWSLCIRAQEQVVFDHNWLSISLMSQQAARWLSEQVLNSIMDGVYISPSGHHSFVDAAMNSQHIEAVEWQRQAHDEFIADHNGLRLHVEHLEGPFKGGVWSASLGEPGGSLWNSQELSNSWRLKSHQSAQWVLELLARITCSRRATLA